GVAGGILEVLALARGGDALGGASETGGATEVCPLAPSLRPGADKHEAESQDRHASHPHPSNRSGPMIEHGPSNHAGPKTIRTQKAVKARERGDVVA
ncbi:hypothetical protein, partial [Bradyrhizobium japonicum]|uniref:hypothetical protein n=1 Tax=Bradyrhizobium japonicum TaxID=375 RepID=UPI001AEC0AE6